MGVFFSPFISFAAPYAFPVPYIEREHGRKIYFQNLPGEGTITIINMAGEEVARLSIGAGEFIKDWDVVTSSGKALATGVYFYVIDAGGQEKKGKLVVIR